MTQRKTLADKLEQIQQEGREVELYFRSSTLEAPNYYLARILEVGDEWVEFEALDEHGTVTARNVMPLSIFSGATLTCTDMVREQLIRSLGGGL